MLAGYTVSKNSERDQEPGAAPTPELAIPAELATSQDAVVLGALGWALPRAVDLAASAVDADAVGDDANAAPLPAVEATLAAPLLPDLQPPAEAEAAAEAPEGSPEVERAQDAGAQDAIAAQQQQQLERRVAALKGDALKAELSRVLGTRTGGVRGVAAQRERLLAALRAKEAVGAVASVGADLVPTDASAEASVGADAAGDDAIAAPLPVVAAALAAPLLPVQPPAEAEAAAAEVMAPEGVAEGVAQDASADAAPEDADAAQLTLEQRVAALKGDALKAELSRLFGTQTGGVKGVAAQREKLLAALRAEEAGERIPGQWAEGMMPDPDPAFAPPEGEEEGPKGEAARLMEDENATPLDFFLLFFTSAILGT